MKKILYMALLAMTFFACKKDPNTSDQKSMAFGIGISTLQSKSIGGSAANLTAASVRAAIKEIHFELLSSAGVTLQTIAINNEQLAAIKRGETVLIENVPYKTTQVVALVNTTTEMLVNGLQANSTTPYPLETMVYSGKSPVSKTGQDHDGKELWEAIVDIYPGMSRFEVIGASSDVVVINKPSDIPNATRPKAEEEFGTDVVLKAEQSAREEWVLANTNVQPAGEFTYKYAITYENLPAYNMMAISAVYANNFIEDKSKPTILGFNSNNSAGDWSQTAQAHYATGGKHDKMWDVGLGTRPDVVAYNLFPQMTNKTNIVELEQEMPHIIFKLTMAGGVAPLPTTSTRWITIRSFFDKANPADIISSFVAGSAYQLDLKDLELSIYRATLVVTAVADGKEVPGKPEIEDEDETDPNPEQEGADLRVGITIKDWRIIGVTPNL